MINIILMWWKRLTKQRSYRIRENVGYYHTTYYIQAKWYELFWFDWYSAGTDLERAKAELKKRRAFSGPKSYVYLD